MTYPTLLRKQLKTIETALVGALIFLAPLPFANACGVSYLGEDYRVAFLNPYVVGEDFAAFFYSADRINMEHFYDKFGSDRRRNCEEWAQYIGGGASASDARAVVYQSSYDDFLNALADGPESDRFAGNVFFKNLLKPEHKAALDYLTLAKKYEHVTFLQEQDVWASDAYSFSWSQNDLAMPSVGTKAQSSLAKEYLKQFKVEKDPFLRRRYAYQLLVTHGAVGSAAEALYQEFFAKDNTSVLSDWATFHKASWVKDTVEANYLLAISFGKCPEKRLACYNRFRKDLLPQTLNLCKTGAERALVLALAQLGNPGRSLSEIQKIYGFDPASPLLPVLLVREVSKLEDWLLTNEVTGMGEGVNIISNDETRWEWTAEQWDEFRKTNRSKDLAYLAEVRNFIADLSSKKSGVNADLTKLLTAHLYLMEKNGGQAKPLLSAISGKANSAIAEQKNTEEVLLLLNSEDLSKAATQEKMVGLLNRLNALKDGHPKGYRDFMSLNLLVSQAYEKKGDLVTAFFLNNSHTLELPTDQRYDYGTAYYDLIRFLDWRASEKDVDAVLALMDKKNKNAFETYLTSGYLPSRNALLDLRGTISFRKNDLPEAIKGFKQVQPDFWTTKHQFSDYLVSDPFVMWRDSLHRGQFPATKTALVQQMLDLETEAKNNPGKAADNYTKLGTAWYNFSYPGKSWMMFSYGQSTGEQDEESQRWYHYSFSPKGKDMNQVYYHGSRALAYLEKAKAALKDKELLAQIAFVETRLAAETTAITDEEQRKMNEMDWEQAQIYQAKWRQSFFKSWGSDYRSTAWFKEASGICPVLLTYAGK